MTKLRVLDLFSGIGGFSLGLERTGGFETVAFCEIDKHAQRVLRKHWPETPIFEDVTKLKGSRVKGIDVICGGFPCQDISVAGKQKGLEGERSGLWSEFKRLIKEIKPRYAIIENVANLRSKGLSTVLKDLWEIGYASEWHLISASAVGAPHLRERIWIIAYPKSSRAGIDQSRVRGQSGGGSVQTDRDSHQEVPKFTDAHGLRLWRAFASEEEASRRWAEAASQFHDVFKQVLSTEPAICGGDDGFPARLDKGRRERIKQLGNAVVPQIPQLIGQALLDYERRQRWL